MLTLDSQNVLHIYCTNIMFMSPKFESVCSMGNLFELQAILREVHPMIPE